MLYNYLVNKAGNNFILNSELSIVPNYNFYLFFYNKNYNLFEGKERLFLSSIDKNNILFYLHFLKDHYNNQFKLFTDLTAGDFLGKKKRFNLIYNLLSLTYHTRILVNIWNNELEFVSSCISIFPSAEWYERETWDLFGIGFKGNKDLRRILTDYGFYGHPLRKDFPLTGYVELGYDLRINSIIYKNVTLIQEFREFDTLSPWDFFINNLPKQN